MTFGRSTRLAALRGGILLGALAAMAPSAFAQSTTTIVVGKDATIRAGSYANKKHGRENFLATRSSDNPTYERRAALTFDTESRLPAKTHIQSARLVLTLRGGNDATRRLSAHTLPISFEEAQVTWRQRRNNARWRYAGGDVTGSPVSATVSAVKGSHVTFDVTAMVQRVVNGNYGSRFARFVVADAGGSSRASYKEFHSREASNAALRPRLIVTYGKAASAPSNPAPTPTPAPKPAPPAKPDPDPAPAPNSRTLKVLHWNIGHGRGTDGRYDINRIANWIAKLNPDVVSLNEVEKNTGWGSEDQPRRFRDMLSSATGRTWYYQFANRYGNGAANGQGNLILSRYPFASTGREALTYDRAVAIGQIVVNGRTITIMSIHLDAESYSRRETQVNQLSTIASAWSNPRIIAGDFNAWPDHKSIAMMTGRYRDSWADAARAGDASSFSGNSPFGATRSGRIDYIFHSPNSVLRIQSVRVVDTRNSSGKMPSDHRPLMTTYEVPVELELS